LGSLPLLGSQFGFVRSFSSKIGGVAKGCPTVCVTGAGAGVDSVWEQKKPEARKMLENVPDGEFCTCAVIGVE